jgi:SAM-dependent methyltransferase
MTILKNIFRDDQSFDGLYPEHFQNISKKHWTPLSVAVQATEFLASPSARVLDIGSGIGKFCIIGANLYPRTMFFGVEQRMRLVCCAESAKELLKLKNVEFIHANLVQLNFSDFDHFYFYNSFFENIDFANRIDDSIETSLALYAYYTLYLRTEMDKMPVGTRIVVYQGSGNELPESYTLDKSGFDGMLNMYTKSV